jgi:hypothetical protein
MRFKRYSSFEREAVKKVAVEVKDKNKKFKSP